MDETIGMKELGNGVDLEEAADDGATEETNVDEDDELLTGNNPNKSINVRTGFNPHPDDNTVLSGLNPDLDDNTVPNVNEHSKEIDDANAEDKKDLLRKLGLNLDIKDGPYSKQLFKRLGLTERKKPGEINSAKSSLLDIGDNTKPSTSSLKVQLLDPTEKYKKTNNGLEFDGVKITKMKGDDMVYTEDKAKQSVVSKFNDLVEKAVVEHSKKDTAPVEEQLRAEGLDTPPELANSVVENSIENIDDRISEISDNVELIVGEKDMVISDNALRELRAPLFAKEANKGTMEYLDINAKHWVDMAKEIPHEPGREKETKLYETVAAASMLRADQIRLRLGLRPQYEEALKNMREETDVNILTRFERFKKWVKENLGAISVAGIITTIAVGFKSALRTGAKATSNIAKALANLAKKVAPILGTVLSIISTVLSMGAKGLAFLSKNLWILAIALGYFLYNEIRKKYKKR